MVEIDYLHLNIDLWVIVWHEIENNFNGKRHFIKSVAGSVIFCVLFTVVCLPHIDTDQFKSTRRTTAKWNNMLINLPAGLNSTYIQHRSINTPIYIHMECWNRLLYCVNLMKSFKWNNPRKQKSQKKPLPIQRF